MTNEELADELHRALKGNGIRESNGMTREKTETLNSLGKDLREDIIKSVHHFSACANGEGIPELPTTIHLCCVLSSLYEDTATIIEQNDWS